MAKKPSIKKRLRQWLASRQFDQSGHGWLGRLRRRLTDPQLWHFNRHNVAKGAALGLFIAFIPLPLQIILALLGAILFRVNLPTTVVLTWVTNPFTFVPMLYLSYRVGNLFLLEKMPLHLPSYANCIGTWSWLTESWHWLVTLGRPILIGAPILAVSAAILGYVAVMLIWRLHTWFEHRKRKQARQIRER